MATNEDLDLATTGDFSMATDRDVAAVVIHLHGWAQTGHGLVAHNVGFYDQAHLTRHFSQQIGTTPARYAASRRLT